MSSNRKINSSKTKHYIVENELTKEYKHFIQVVLETNIYSWKNSKHLHCL